MTSLLNPMLHKTVSHAILPSRSLIRSGQILLSPEIKCFDPAMCLVLLFHDPELYHFFVTKAQVVPSFNSYDQFLFCKHEMQRAISLLSPHSPMAVSYNQRTPEISWIACALFLCPRQISLHQMCNQTFTCRIHSLLHKPH